MEKVLIDRRALFAAGVGTAMAASMPSQAQPTVSKETRIIPAQRSWEPPPVMRAAREGLAELPGVKLYYWDTGGNGETIVLLHPATGSANVWAYQQRVFQERGYRVIGYSRRGHAGSEAGPLPPTVSAGEDLTNLMNFLKVDRFHLLGSAAGGFIVPAYALANPERLLSCTIACSQAGVSEPSYRAKITAMNPPNFSTMPASFRELGPSYRAANRPGVAAWEALEHASRSVPERVRQPSGGSVLFKDLANIRTPTLIFTGGADLYQPPALMLEVASHIPGAETAVITEAGHSAYWEQPLAFNKLVLDFVDRH